MDSQEQSNSIGGNGSVLELFVENIQKGLCGEGEGSEIELFLVSKNE